MSKRIEDEFTHLPVSHQRKSHLRWRRDGKCVQCGGERTPESKRFCLKHLQYRRAASFISNRKRSGIPLDAPLGRTSKYLPKP